MVIMCESICIFQGALKKKKKKFNYTVIFPLLGWILHLNTNYDILFTFNYAQHLSVSSSVCLIFTKLSR